jgi:hypothetical protein
MIKASMIKRIVKFFDRVEDKIRGKLSHYPIVYAFIGGIGVVLFWRGVWHIADEINLESGASLIIGAIILMISGIFVYEFIGTRIIASGLAGEQELTEKEEIEIETEETQIKKIQNTLTRVEQKLEHLDKEIEEKK